MKLIQYWDTGDPPDDVAGWVDGFRVMNPEMEHRLYSRDDAAWFIKKRLGQRHLKAFEACAVPAMQADYFRLCAVWLRGGLYLDADFRCVAPVSGLLASFSGDMMPLWHRSLINNVILCPTPRNPFLGAALELSTRNIVGRLFRDLLPMQSVTAIAGPDVYNAIWSAALPDDERREWERPDVKAVLAPELVTAQVRDALERVAMPPVGSLRKWLGWVNPSYQETERHWLRWAGPIYNDQQVPVEVR